MTATETKARNEALHAHTLAVCEWQEENEAVNIVKRCPCGRPTCVEAGEATRCRQCRDDQFDAAERFALMQ